MGHLRRPKLSHLWDIDKHLSNYSLSGLFIYVLEVGVTSEF